jgi:hypothetical protein
MMIHLDGKAGVKDQGLDFILLDCNDLLEGVERLVWRPRISKRASQEQALGNAPIRVIGECAQGPNGETGDVYFEHCHPIESHHIRVFG